MGKISGTGVTGVGDAGGFDPAAKPLAAFAKVLSDSSNYHPGVNGPVISLKALGENPLPAAFKVLNQIVLNSPQDTSPRMLLIKDVCDFLDRANSQVDVNGADEAPATEAVVVDCMISDYVNGAKPISMAINGQTESLYPTDYLYRMLQTLPQQNPKSSEFQENLKAFLNWPGRKSVCDLCYEKGCMNTNDNFDSLNVLKTLANMHTPDEYTQLLNENISLMMLKHAD